MTPRWMAVPALVAAPAGTQTGTFDGPAGGAYRAGVMEHRLRSSSLGHTLDPVPGDMTIAPPGGGRPPHAPTADPSPLTPSR